MFAPLKSVLQGSESAIHSSTFEFHLFAVLMLKFALNNGILKGFACELSRKFFEASQVGKGAGSYFTFRKVLHRSWETDSLARADFVTLPSVMPLPQSSSPFSGSNDDIFAFVAPRKVASRTREQVAEEQANSDKTVTVEREKRTYGEQHSKDITGVENQSETAPQPRPLAADAKIMPSVIQPTK
uniref:Uncharacterized protein n=1 Tax=Parascaris univalens TaxID=6257 RepID=A0A914ZZA9_PARUN